jgi:penicillin-binding protein 2
MERVVTKGTARRFGAVEGLRIAGKTGTAQRERWKDGKRLGMLELAWYACFAPIEKPEIAIAVIVEGDTPDESYAGGAYAAPVARAILQKWLEKKQRPAAAPKEPIFKPVLSQ